MAVTACRLLAGILIAHACLVNAAGAAGSPRYQGRPVAEVLAELREPGLGFIYSSELLPPTLTVVAEPRSLDRLLLATEILAPHGLALDLVGPGLYAVVAAKDRPAHAAVPAPDTRPLPTRTELAEIIVSTSRYSLDHSTMGGSVRIGGELLVAQPVLGEDAIRAVGRLPGIAQGGLSAQSSIRGGESGEVLTLLDGFPLRQPFHLPGYQSVFGVLDPGLIAAVDVFTGGFPARYGNRMAGVFDLETIAATDEPRTALGLSVFNAMARRGGRLGGADWLAAARVGTLKPFVDAFAHDAGEPTYADTYARAGFGGPEGLRVTANLLWSRDELTIAREHQDERAQIESRSRYLWLRADRSWGDAVSGSLWLGHSRVHASRIGSVDDPDFAMATVDDRRSSEYRELRARIDWDAAADHWLEGGFEWTEEKADYFYAAQAAYPAAVAALFGRDATLSRAATISPRRERVALFATHRWQIGRDLISELGLRTQRTLTEGATTENWSYDPRVNLRWEISPTTSLRAHWGRFHQTDEVHELKVEDGLAEFPDAQSSDHFIVGLDHRLASGLGMRLEWFRKLQTEPRPHFENLLDPLSLVPEVAPDRVMIAAQSADIRGAELSLVSESRQLGWWASFAWSEAKDIIDGRRVPRSWDQSWAVTAGIDWTRGDWRLGAVAAARRGWPTTAVLATSLGARNAARFPTRVGLDLRAEYRRPLAVGRLAVTIEVTNALNLGNACCQELMSSPGDAGGVIFASKRSDWLPVVPSIGVLWEF
ncbi:MAG TPA: TonB-dependent receptor [Steroidobacteraceae bacterium]|nr:TonB-dependent receptor [Steroidobacteraceae bacterium]